MPASIFMVISQLDGKNHEYFIVFVTTAFVCAVVYDGQTQWQQFSFRQHYIAFNITVFTKQICHRFMIAYCFTKTTLGQHTVDTIQHATTFSFVMHCFN